MDSMTDAADRLLLIGADDWIQAVDIYHAVQKMSGPESREDWIAACVGLVRELLTRDLVTVGDVTKNGFTPWSLSVDEAIAEITLRWAALADARPRLGDLVCWLELTPRGRAAAGEVRAAGLFKNSPEADQPIPREHS
jgi:hypothetical protein